MLAFPILLASLFSAPPDPEAAFNEARERMVEEQVAGRGIADPLVLASMRRVPRHRFMRPGDERFAYGDHPYPIGEGQTISQPYIVALMAELAELTGRERVLEIGAGSGYGAAVLAGCAAAVYSVELLPSLAERARATLEATGHANVEVTAGDGFLGRPDAAPFDAILLTCATPRIPGPLAAQLAEGGRLIAPVGTTDQTLVRHRKQGGVLIAEPGLPVRFVPMRGIIEGKPAPGVR